jgi:hypothetical protein
MRRILSFTLGVMVGTVVATAWANYPTKTPSEMPAVAGTMNPHAMMLNTQSLPVESHDAI